MNCVYRFEWERYDLPKPELFVALVHVDELYLRRVERDFAEGFVYSTANALASRVYVTAVRANRSGAPADRGSDA